jgi:anti-sigma factor ChrR (cupin superfamily)
LSEIRQRAVAVGSTATLATPSPGLRDRVIAIAKGLEVSPAQIQITKHTEGEWQEVGAGVQLKHLYAEAGGERITMLVRMAAGASYGAHLHAGPEQCYVLEGDLHHGNT